MPGWRILLWVILVVITLLFLYLVRGILLPFLLSFIIAALLEPSVRKLRLKGLSRNWAVATVVGSFVVVVLVSAILLVPSIVRESSNLRDEVVTVTRNYTEPPASENFFVRWNPVVQAKTPQKVSQVDRILSAYRGTLERFGLPTTQQGIVERYVQPQRAQIAAAVQAAVLSLFGFLTGILSHIVFVFAIPLLVWMISGEMEEIKKAGPKWIPPAIRPSALAILGDVGQVFIKYLHGITKVVLLFTAAQTAVMLLLGVPYAILLGPLFGILYLIPYIGNIISALTVLGVVGFSDVHSNMLFGLPNPWAYAILATCVYLAIGLMFDHLIYPQMVGQSVGLNPVASMFVIFSGAALFGVPGMLIAFPLAGSVKVVLDRLIRVTSTGVESLRLPATPLRHRTT